MRAFYEPVALTHPEISDIARALNVMQRSPIHSSGVYWCRCPAGVTPDLYVSHLRNVELEDDDAWDADSADISPSAHGKPCPPRLLYLRSSPGNSSPSLETVHPLSPRRELVRVSE